MKQKITMFTEKKKWKSNFLLSDTKINYKNNSTIKYYNNTISSSSKIVSNNKNIYNKELIEESLSNNSINTTENLKRQRTEEKFLFGIKQKSNTRPIKYMESTKEIDRILSSIKTRSTLNSLLINVNMATPVTVSKKTFLVQNTCPFDVISVLIATAFTDFQNYKNYTKKRTEIILLNFVKALLWMVQLIQFINNE